MPKAMALVEVAREEVDIAAMANDIDRTRKALLAATKEAEVAQEKCRTLREILRTLTARLMEAINGPKKPRSGAAAVVGPQWPLARGSRSRTLILKELDDVGPMTVHELRKALPGISEGALRMALAKLRDQQMIEKLTNGSWALTEKQQGLMRAEDTDA